MLPEFSVNKCTKRCAISGHHFEPGEAFVSTVVQEGDAFIRVDVAAGLWQGPQPKTVGWWRSKMPKENSRQLRPAPNGVLLDVLTELAERPDKQMLTYVLAMLLVRRRILTEELQTSDEGSPYGQSPIWELTCPADGRTWKIPVVELDASCLDTIQGELRELLYTEA
ncbi:MAG: hypothetical protein KDB03_18415 [Planctomycetales bacterium]|nr:hypothetical protein [Planctomycetales bacterium]